MVSDCYFVLPQVNFCVFNINGHLWNEINNIAKEYRVNQHRRKQTCVVELPAMVHEHHEDPNSAGDNHQERNPHLALGKDDSFMWSLQKGRESVELIHVEILYWRVEEFYSVLNICKWVHF